LTLSGARPRQRRPKVDGLPVDTIDHQEGSGRLVVAGGGPLCQLAKLLAGRR